MTTSDPTIPELVARLRELRSVLASHDPWPESFIADCMSFLRNPSLLDALERGTATRAEEPPPSSPWLPIAECGELETGREYLVRMQRGKLEPHITVARWSGAAWQVRIVDAEHYYYRAEHITHVHRMGPIRGPGEG